MVALIPNVSGTLDPVLPIAAGTVGSRRDVGALVIQSRAVSRSAFLLVSATRVARIRSTLIESGNDEAMPRSMSGFNA